jgi:hypothetical protein
LDGGEKIGTLIACSKRQQYAMLCEAELDSGGSTGRGSGGGRAEVLSKGEPKLRQKNSAHVGRSANHPGANLLAWKCSRSKNQIRRQNGYEDLNLFAWTGV